MRSGKFNAVLTSLIPIGMMALLLISCTPQTRKTENPFFDKWREHAESSIGHSPNAKSIESRLSKQDLGYEARQLIKTMKEKPLPATRITVKLKEMEVAAVLRAVSRAVNQNILINEAVRGSVTVDVKNVPWSDVFLGILKTLNLSYAWEGDIIRVMTADEKQAEIKRDIQTLIIPIEYSDAAKLKANIQAILTSQSDETLVTGQPVERKNGSVLVDEHNNALIIQASRERIQKLLPLIESLDRPTNQILIEAQIVEATKETARELGIQWGGLYNSGNSWIYPGVNSEGISGQALPGGPGVGGVGVGSALSPTTGFAANFPADITAGTGPGFSIGYLLTQSGKSVLAAQLSALQTDGKLNILSSPSITTLDNQQALIESGAEVPFQTTDENGRIVIEFKKATLILEVTPHVIDQETLRLKIQTKKDELDFTNTVLGNPTILTKNAETNVVLHDGETTVIAGLNRETDQASDAGIPGLKNVPIVGWLFKNDSRANKMEELLIFITPYILKKRISGEAQ